MSLIEKFIPKKNSKDYVELGYKGRMGTWKNGELSLDGVRKIAYVLSRVNCIDKQWK